MNLSTKVLFPLATAGIAGAVAIGSGATFSSQSNNTISAVTSGSLTQSNSKDGGAVFNLTDLKPGDILNGTLVLTNTGSLPAAFSLTEVSSANGFTADNLTLSINDSTTGVNIYNGPFGGLVDGAKTDVGTIASHVSNTFTFTVKLASTTPNADQGKTASAVYQWDSVQLAGSTTNQ
jgi:spore coat-associated protein N